MIASTLLAFLLAAAAPPEDPPASPLLPASHWAVQAAWRLEALGLLEAWLPAQREVPLAAVEGALREGARRAPAEAPVIAELAQGLHRRLLEEWRAPQAAAPELLGGAISARLDARGRDGEPPLSPDSDTLLVPPSSSRPSVSAAAAGSAGGWLAFAAEAAASRDALEVERLELVAAAGPWQLSLGRTPVGYGPSQQGGIVAAGAQTLDRLEVRTARPLRLPGPLGLLAFESFIARISEPRHPYHPFLFDFSLQWRPHPRVALGLQRGVMFGGAGWAGRTAREVLLLVTGLGNGSENNVVSVSARLRLPSERWLPVTVYGEWGTDDNGGAWYQVPGLVAGLLAPALPGLPSAAAGLELSYLGRLCCRDIRWYAHPRYGWSSLDLPLGLPLGGNGRELRAYGSVDLAEARLRLRMTAFLRERFSGNLYAPAYGGESRGFEASAALRASAVAELVLRAAAEWGDAWSASSLAVRASLLF